MKKKLLAAALVLVLMTTAGLAQILIGISPGVPVHDAAANVSLLVQIGHAVTQIEKAAAIVNNTMLQYQHMLYMAEYLRARTGWWTPLPPWRATVARDSFGLNAGYLAALNYGANGAAGLASSVEPLANPAWAHGLRMQQEFAAQERADGTIAHSLELIGGARANEPQARAALLKLQQTALSAAAADNTEAAQLNVISAAATFTAQNSQVTNDALLSTLETLAHQQAIERQGRVQELNDELYRRAYQERFMASQAAGTTAGLRSLRIP